MKKMQAHPDHRAVADLVLATALVTFGTMALLLFLIVLEPPGLLLLPFVLIGAYWVGKQMDKQV
jgi:hypothetical protein